MRFRHPFTHARRTSKERLLTFRVSLMGLRGVKVVLSYYLGPVGTYFLALGPCY